MNVWYVEHVSLRLDLRILAQTVLKVFSNADNENVGATLFPVRTEEKESVNV